MEVKCPNMAECGDKGALCRYCESNENRDDEEPIEVSLGSADGSTELTWKFRIYRPSEDEEKEGG